MDVNRFLELFSPRPGNRYILITDKEDETSLGLSEFLKKVDGELRVVCYRDDVSEKNKSTTTQYIHNFSAPFRALPREHDMVIFKDILHLHDNPDKLLKIAYTTLANNANIVIIQERGTMDIEALKEKLENFEFRAANYIDLLPEYDLVVAKKMHMWGNGL